MDNGLSRRRALPPPPMTGFPPPPTAGSALPRRIALLATDSTGSGRSRRPFYPRPALPATALWTATLWATGSPDNQFSRRRDLRRTCSTGSVFHRQRTRARSQPRAFPSGAFFYPGTARFFVPVSPTATPMEKTRQRMRPDTPQTEYRASCVALRPDLWARAQHQNS